MLVAFLHKAKHYGLGWLRLVSMYDPHLGGGGGWWSPCKSLLKAISFGSPLFLNLSLVRLGKVQKFIFGRIVGWGGASLYIVFVVVSPLRYEVASSVAFVLPSSDSSCSFSSGFQRLLTNREVVDVDVTNLLYLVQAKFVVSRRRDFRFWALDPFMSFSLSFLLSSSIFPFSPHCWLFFAFL